MASITTRYQPGGFSRVLGSVAALPWRGWWVFPLLYGALFAWSHAILWATGRLPLGTFHPVFVVSAFYAPYTLAASAYINRAAERALVKFWPATGWPEPDREAWRFQFVTSPGGYGLRAFGIALLVTIIAFQQSPPDVFGSGADRVILFAAYLPVALLGYWIVVLALAHTIRQLRLVARIHREAASIDPFDRVPLYAFSSVTVRTGLAYVFSGYYTLTVNGAFQAGNLVAIAVLGAVFAIGILCFFLPLWGIHDRLVQEKDALMRELDRRHGQVGEELYRRIDAGQFEATKAVGETLAAVSELRKRIIEVPTWPWRPQVLSGFISALLVPVAVYLLTRAVAAQIGP